MEIGQTIPLWEGVFHITSLRNKGAAFGILQGQRWFFIIVTLIVVLGIIYYLQTEGRNNRRISFALSLLLGGALGNFFDRLIRGEVIDSLDFRLIDYPIFNLADVFIVSGVALMILVLRMLLLHTTYVCYVIWGLPSTIKKGR
ncbi:signal peptidase II [Staphylococcus epidermidis]|uniref:signal peptidase II n=1 Tax=Staphylococcus epidermidis TaxID=1282 RepID=UPI0015C30CC1